MTFDEILPAMATILTEHKDVLEGLEWLLINRDLNGRVRLIVPEAVKKEEEKRNRLKGMAATIDQSFKPHAYPPNAGILYESDRELACQGAAKILIPGHEDKVWVVDRLATVGNWGHIEAETKGPPRIVFFSIKGGVGRSTALATTAWKLAQTGQRVLVLDLDLQSPGLSTSLLAVERQPMYGVTDWLMEDLVDNADAVFASMLANSNLSHDGEIHVVPAHGAKPGEYVAKLGRVWMPKIQQDGTREPWSSRLQRLLQTLEERVRPDVILIDSRAGIDDMASVCLTDLGPTLVLLFALEGNQTWSGYRILFEHWQRAGVAEQIRERLQIVSGLTPEIDRDSYLKGLRERAYQVFIDTLYDEIPPLDAIIRQNPDGQRWTLPVGPSVEGWSFDEADESAPHYPWAVYWHRSFAGLNSLHGRLAGIDPREAIAVFGPLIAKIFDCLDLKMTYD
ncbi:MAG: ParA family protein [Magnetococcales bacterium]|nr:ParA family protein [Magnetococcales bacterium]